jgi:hypothetical protein
MPTESLSGRAERQGQVRFNDILNIQDARAFYEASGVRKKTIRDKETVKHLDQLISLT